jgi:signal peptidase I
VADRRAGLTAADRPSARGRTVARILSAVAVALVLVVAASVSGLLPVQIVRVDSQSMTPTLEAGDLVLVQRGAGEVDRRDVVVVRHPDTGQKLVKRAVALSGDTVRLDDGVLVVNDAPVCEATIDPDRIDGVFFGSVTVPQGEVFGLGDDRRDSIDSRDFGTIAEEDVLGHVVARVFPSPGSLPSDSC